jgi:hypothetical protein
MVQSDARWRPSGWRHAVRKAGGELAKTAPRMMTRQAPRPGGRHGLFLACFNALLAQLLSKALLSDTHGQLAVHEVQLVSHDTVPEYVSV